MVPGVVGHEEIAHGGADAQRSAVVERITVIILVGVLEHGFEGPVAGDVELPTQVKRVVVLTTGDDRRTAGGLRELDPGTGREDLRRERSVIRHRDAVVSPIELEQEGALGRLRLWFGCHDLVVRVDHKQDREQWHPANGMVQDVSPPLPSCT